MPHIADEGRKTVEHEEANDDRDTPPKQLVSRKLNSAIGAHHEQSAGNSHESTGYPYAWLQRIPCRAQQFSSDGGQKINACKKAASEDFFSKPAKPPQAYHVGRQMKDADMDERGRNQTPILTVQRESPKVGAQAKKLSLVPEQQGNTGDDHRPKNAHIGSNQDVGGGEPRIVQSRPGHRSRGPASLRRGQRR